MLPSICFLVALDSALFESSLLSEGGDVSLTVVLKLARVAGRAVEGLSLESVA